MKKIIVVIIASIMLLAFIAVPHVPSRADFGDFGGDADYGDDYDDYDLYDGIDEDDGYDDNDGFHSLNDNTPHYESNIKSPPAEANLLTIIICVLVVGLIAYRVISGNPAFYLFLDIFAFFADFFGDISEKIFHKKK